MKKIIVIAAGLALFLIGAATALLGVFADDFVEKYRHDVAGLAIQLEDLEINWLSYGVTLKGVKIYPARKERKRFLLASMDEVRVSLVPHDLLRHMIHIRKLTLVKPKVTYIRTSMRHTNWEALNMSWLKEGEKGGLGGWKLRVGELTIEEGRFMFTDRVTGGRFDLREMEASVSNIVEEPDPKKLPSKVKVDGKLSKYDAPVRLRGRMNILAEGLNFNFTSSIKDAPITYFAPFYAGQVPFRIQSGRISVKSKMNVLKSYLKSTHNAAIRNLRVGGIHGKLINPLFLKNKTVYATAVVNGDLEKGNLRVSSQVSKVIGNSIMADAKKLTPLNKMGRGIKKAGEKTGSAVKRLFRRR